MAAAFRRALTPIVIALIAAWISTLLYYVGAFSGAEWRMYDERLAITAQPGRDPRIVIIAIDDRSLTEIGRWPWPRDTHAALIDTLAAAGARTIVYDVEFSEPSADPAEDAALAGAAGRAGNVILPVHGLLDLKTRGGYINSQSVTTPHEPLASAATLAHINVVPDPDGFVRSHITTLASGEETLPSLALAASAMYLGIDTPVWDGESSTLSIGGGTAPLDPAGRFLVNFSRGRDAFRMVSYVDVLRGEADPSLFRDRIVLVAPWAAGLGDQRNFPVLGTSAPGVQVHAHSIATILDGDFIKPVSRVANLHIVMVLVFLAGLVFSRLNPLPGAAALIVLLAGYVLTAYYYFFSGVLINLIHPVLGMVLAYLVNLGYRIILEQRTRLRITGMFQRYVDPEVVKEILAAGEDALRLGGIRRPVTVFFLDVRGFTSLSEKLEPEEVVDVLNRNFEMITQVIFKYGGTLDKFIGDAVMALFNAPLDLPDHPLQAVLAAREIQESAGGIRAELEDTYGRSIHFGIGINTGEAVVGNIGSSTRMEYTAIGDTVNLAARLESNAKPGQILISESTWRAIDSRVDTEPVGPITVKGKSEPVNVYLVTVVTVPDRAESTKSAKSTNLTG